MEHIFRPISASADMPSGNGEPDNDSIKNPGSAEDVHMLFCENCKGLFHCDGKCGRSTNHTGIHCM